VATAPNGAPKTRRLLNDLRPAGGKRAGRHAVGLFLRCPVGAPAAGAECTVVPPASHGTEHSACSDLVAKVTPDNSAAPQTPLPRPNPPGALALGGSALPNPSGERLLAGRVQDFDFSDNRLFAPVRIFSCLPAVRIQTIVLHQLNGSISKERSVPQEANTDGPRSDLRGNQARFDSLFHNASVPPGRNRLYYRKVGNSRVEF